MASIVEYMNQNWMDSSYNNRAKLAKQYGIEGYKWTAFQNNQLLDYIKNWGNNNVVDNQTISNNVKWNVSASKSWYDYSANINTDKKRAAEMKQHLEEYMKSDPSLFKNRWAFESFFDYNWAWRDQSQRDLLDQYWNKANKYWLNATENKYADDASSIAKDANAKKQANMAQALSDLYDMFTPIQSKLSDRTNQLRQQMSSQTAKYLEEEAELKELAREFYRVRTEEYNKSKWSEQMSMASRLSWSWLSYSAIWSSVSWITAKYEKMYNKLLDSHINRMKELSNTYGWFVNNIWNAQSWLTTQEANLATNMANTIWQWIQSFTNLKNAWIDDEYAPYASIAWAKVSWATENQTTESKAQAKQSEYEACTTPAQRADMLARNLQQVLWEWVYSTYYSQIQAAANAYPNDFRKALYAAVDKLWLAKAGWSKTPNPDNPDPDQPDTSDPFAKYRNKDWSINWALYFVSEQDNNNNTINILDQNIWNYTS